MTTNLNRLISNINFCLPFIGFQLITAIFLSGTDFSDTLSEDMIISQKVTIPYRFISLSISLLTIVMNLKKSMRMNNWMKMFFCFWLFLLLRIAYDMFLRTDIVISSSQIRNTITHIIIVLLPLVSIIKSIDVIDYKLCSRIIYTCFILIIPIYYITNPLLFSDSSTWRIAGNIAVSSIALGHFGASLALLSMIYLFQGGVKLNLKIGLVLIFFLGLVVMFRAASRGPLVSLLVSLIIYYFAINGLSIKAIFFSLTLLFVLLFGSGYLLNLINEISPAMISRLTMEGSDFSSGRDLLYDRTINFIIDNPLFGYAYALPMGNGNMLYSHNMVLDAFLGLGILGGTLFLYLIIKGCLNCYSIMHNRSECSWMAILCLQYIVSGQFSGAFYASDLLNILLVVVSVFCYNNYSYRRLV